MANTQETIIYIEKENHIEAEFMSRNFVNKEIKNRAYINAIGAELVMKYLSSEGIKVDEIHNLHSISKILENLDISDILLPNIHIDVRVVFDDAQIFIPKSHLEMEIEPDIYVVLKLEENFKHAELLGYFKPSQINRRNENKEYYFFEKSKLASTDTLTKFIKNFVGKTPRDLSEEDFFRGKELSISLADHNISVAEEKELLELLLLSSALRESVLEFDNFETLSYSTAPVLAEMTTPLAIVEAHLEEASEEVEVTNADESTLATMALDEELAIEEAFPEEEVVVDTAEVSLEEISEEEPTFELEEETFEENTEEFEQVLEEEAQEAVEEENSVLDFDDFDTEVVEEVIEDTETLDIFEESVPVETEPEETTENLVLEETTEDNDNILIAEENILEEQIVQPSEEIVEDIIEEVTEEVAEVSDIENLDELVEEPIEEVIEEELTFSDTTVLDEVAEQPIEEIVEEVEVTPIEESVETLDVESIALEEPTLETEELPIDEAEALPLVEETLQVEETLNIEDDVPSLNLDEAPALEIDSTDLGDDLLGGDILNETEELTETIAETEEVEEEVVPQEPTLPSVEETYTPLALDEMSVDSILDQTIAAIDSKEATEENNTDLDKAASATAEALANAVAEGEAKAVSDEAIKLASVSGDMINDVVQNLENDQQKSLDRIDYEKTDIAPDVDEIPEHIAETEEVEEEVVPQEPTLPSVEETYTPLALDEMSVDSILDQTIAAIDSKEATEENNTDLDKAASATAEALANAVAEGEAKAVSDEAIKLASVSGDMINDVVQNLENDQQKSLDRIDYEKTDIAPDVDEIPEHIAVAAEDLFIAKMESNLEAEESGQLEIPTDISNLNTVETYEEKEFIQESVDFGNMETVSTEELMTQGFENTEIENLSGFDMPVDNFNLPDVNLGKEEGVVDLPQFSNGGFTINEDGSSPMDKMLDMSMAAEEPEKKDDEELMDMELNGASLDFSSCMKPSTRRREESRSSHDESKPTMDEETKKALLANNIIRSSDNDDDVEEDFGETITIPVDDEPFEIDAIDTLEETTEIVEESADELSIEELLGESEEAETMEVTDNEFPFDDIEALSEEDEASADTTSPEELFKDYEEPSVEVQNDEEFLSSAEGFTTDMFDVEEKTEEVAQPEIAEQQDWMEDTDYATLEDVEPQSQEIADDFITEPEANPKEFPTTENSTVISDKTFQTGEIEIDINNQATPQFEGHESLENLYNLNSKVPGGALLQNPGRLGSGSQARGAAGLMGVLGTLIVLALVGGIGFGVAKFFKAPTEEAPQPITDEPLTSTDNGVTDANTLQIDPNNVVNMDNNYNAIEKSAKTTNVAKPSTQKKGTAKAFVEIKDMKWTLPDYISKNGQFLQYFQSASKSLKLSLTTDLLLASDYIYSDQMRVAITFEKDGAFGNSQVITSSGSNQIDKIVLQTVNQTLKHLKAPNSVGNDENTTAVLNIYF